MEYYTSHEKKPTDYRKTIDLKNCEDMIAPLVIPSKGFVIKLSVKNGEKMRDYLFECFSENDMNDWVKCLARVCGFTPGTSVSECVCVCVCVCVYLFARDNSLLL